MRKLLLLITILLSLAVFLSACSTVNNPASTTAPVTENPATTPTVIPVPTTNTYVLSGLTISTGTLSPVFSSGTIAYSVSVDYSVSSVTVTPVAVGTSGTITVNGTAVTSGNASGAISLGVGTNAITVIITPTGGSATTYTISITRQADTSTPATPDYVLSGITLSAGSVSPVFDSSVLSYTASVSNSTTGVTVTSTAIGSGGTITVNGSAVASGSTSSSVTLSVGDNTITIVVTKADSTTKTYTITVTKEASGSVNTTAPTSPVKLIFVHHSIGENWLADNDGGLGLALRNNNYFVSDTNYYWGPAGNLSLGIGTYTDIGYWYNWFRGSYSSTYLSALYSENQMHNLNSGVAYSRLATEPVGDNEIILFKSGHLCSNLKGTTTEAVPAIGSNPLVGRYQDEGDYHSVANAKGIYIELLNYFATRQDKLFIVITAPPVTTPTYADNARYFNNWLVNDWLDSYAYNNVAVFDFYNVLTHPDNHHRINNGVVVHEVNNSQNISSYPGGVGGGDHINSAGGQKATTEFLPLLNYYYNTWKGN